MAERSAGGLPFPAFTGRPLTGSVRRPNRCVHRFGDRGLPLPAYVSRVQTDIHAEPLHLRILVPFAVSIALTAALVAAATIVLIVTAPADLTYAAVDGSVASVLHAIVAVIVDAFWALVGFL
jgi:hypothetical protein